MVDIMKTFIRKKELLMSTRRNQIEGTSILSQQQEGHHGPLLSTNIVVLSDGRWTRVSWKGRLLLLATRM